MAIFRRVNSRRHSARVLPGALRAVLGCALLLSFAAILAAQTTEQGPPVPDLQAPLTDMSLEDLLKLKVDTVYAASKFVQEVAQAPASVSIITAAEIRDHGYRTLADILRSVRGFYVSYDRDYSYVGVRGFARPGDYNSRVLVMVNGHRLNDTIFEAALLGTESPLDVALFERVEVIRGPSSSLYGTSAFFAVVNIITRSGRSLKGVEVEGQIGSQALRSGRVTGGGRTSGGVEGLFSLSAFDTSGNQRLYYPEFDTAADGDGIAHHADADELVNVFGSAAARGLQVQVGYGSRRKTIPTAAFGTLFNDPRTLTRDARGFVSVQLTRPVRRRSTLQARVAYDHYEYDGTYAYDSGLFRDWARGAWITTKIALVRRLDRHSLTAGLEYRNNLRQNQWAVDETGVVLDDRRRSETAAVYVEDEVRIHRRVLLNAGLRWDRYFDTFGGTLNPRLGLIVSPYEGAALKLLYGRAFRAPNPFELYYYGQIEPSAGLKPERIVTHELVWEQRVNPRRISRRPPFTTE